MSELRYPKALVKISGESLAGDQGFGIEPQVVEKLTREVGEVHAAGVELGLGGAGRCGI